MKTPASRFTLTRLRTAAVIAIAIALLSSSVIGQQAGTLPPDLEWGQVRAMRQRAALAQAHTPQRPGRSLALMTPVERRQSVDSLWGPGEPTEVKLRIFDQFWNYVDARFAAFQGITVDWRALRD